MEKSLFPQKSINPRIPPNVFIVAEIETMSGEITTTYYIDESGNAFSCGDWSTDKPYPVYMFEICRLTGCTENDITFRWKSFYNIPTGIDNPISIDLF